MSNTYSSATLAFRFLHVALICLVGTPLFAREIDIGHIDVQGGRTVIPVSIVSDQADMRQAAERAFSAHGGYRVAGDRSSASFIFTFRASGANGVHLDISSGSPPRSQFQQMVNGSTRHNALMRAADLAVTKTSGLPGFFAGQLTFISDATGTTEVYVADLFMTQPRRVTNDRAKCVSPRWSPDGQSILYTSYFRSGFPDIFRINVANRSREPFISIRGTNTGARYSPDGARIAMILSGEGTPELYVSNSAGRQIRRLTRTNAVQASPSWSPDGSRIVFASDRDGRPQLFTINAAGGTMTRIPTNISGNCTEPDWNPRDPNLIAFTAAVSGRFAVAIYDFSTRQSRFVTQGPGDGVHPRWTNDGRHLIYTSRTATTSVLMVLDTHTGQSAPLTSRSLGKASQPDFWIQ